MSDLLLMDCNRLKEVGHKIKTCFIFHLKPNRKDLCVWQLFIKKVKLFSVSFWHLSLQKTQRKELVFFHKPIYATQRILEVWRQILKICDEFLHFQEFSTCSRFLFLVDRKYLPRVHSSLVQDQCKWKNLANSYIKKNFLVKWTSLTAFNSLLASRFWSFASEQFTLHTQKRSKGPNWTFSLRLSGPDPEEHSNKKASIEHWLRKTFQRNYSAFVEHIRKFFFCL